MLDAAHIIMIQRILTHSINQSRVRTGSTLFTILSVSLGHITVLCSQPHCSNFNSSHAVRDLSRVRLYPPWLLFTAFCRFRGVPKVQPAEDTQTMTHARSKISLVVLVISRSKNNFYDVIRLKIIESRYFPKATVKVGFEKIKQNGGQLKATKCL